MRARSRSELLEARQAAEYMLARTNGLSSNQIEADFELSLVVERLCERIGEALKRLRENDSETAERIPRHRKSLAVRNFIAHEYYDTNWKSVRRTLGTSVPALLTAVDELLDSYPGEAN